QLAFPCRLVIIVSAIKILSNIHSFDPQFTFNKETKRIYKTCLSSTDRLDLSTSQLDSGIEFLQNLKIKVCPAILYIYVICSHLSNQFIQDYLNYYGSSVNDYRYCQSYENLL